MFLHLPTRGHIADASSLYKRHENVKLVLVGPFRFFSCKCLVLWVSLVSNVGHFCKKSRLVTHELWNSLRPEEVLVINQLNAQNLVL